MRLTFFQSTFLFLSTGFFTWFAANSRQNPSTSLTEQLPVGFCNCSRPAMRSVAAGAASRSARRCLRLFATFLPKRRSACSSSSHISRSVLEANANIKAIFLPIRIATVHLMPDLCPLQLKPDHSISSSNFHNAWISRTTLSWPYRAVFPFWRYSSQSHPCLGRLTFQQPTTALGP
jgi:hypothetical protein